MWTHDGTWHRFSGSNFTISVLEDDPPDFTLSVDVEVNVSGQRYSATFFTPEQMRECLTRWATTGESLPGDVFGVVPDLVIVGALTLDGIEAAVRYYFEGDSDGQQPFVLLDDD